MRNRKLNCCGLSEMRLMTRKYGTQRITAVSHKSYINSCTLYILRRSYWSSLNDQSIYRWWETWFHSWLGYPFIVCWWCHKAVQERSVTSLQYMQTCHTWCDLHIMHTSYVMYTYNMYTLPRHGKARAYDPCVNQNKFNMTTMGCLWAGY